MHAPRGVLRPAARPPPHLPVPSHAPPLPPPLPRLPPPTPLLPQYPLAGWSAADLAASRGHSAALALLLDAGALRPDADGPLDAAAVLAGPANALHLAVSGGDADCLGLILRQFSAAPPDPEQREWARRFCNAPNKARRR